jgi:tRNA A37 threonylcarbamoyltransferase TsaD
VRGTETAIEYAADFSQFQPNVSLIVSGGHTILVLVERIEASRARLDD